MTMSLIPALEIIRIHELQKSTGKHIQYTDLFKVKVYLKPFQNEANLEK